MIDALGLIFTDGFDVELDPLIERRTVASIPFGARYRLIDFPLSNLANAGVRNIGIITKKNYQSLMEHIRGGAEWDLNLRSTGLIFLPPFSTQVASEPEVYRNRLDGLTANIPFLQYQKEEYVIIMGNDFIWNEDLGDFFRAHVESGAQVTCMYTKQKLAKNPNTDSTFVFVGEDGRLCGQSISNTQPEGSFMSMDSYIMKRETLLSILKTAAKGSMTSMRSDVLAGMIERGEANGYEIKSEVLHIDSLQTYLEANLALLDRRVRLDLFADEENPVFTHMMDSAPAKYGKNAVVSNSIIADGVLIEGEVRNCIIFRNVRVKEGAVVENSVIMNDTVIGSGARLNYCILDKNIIINDGRWLSGYITHPFYSNRGSVI